MKIVSLQEFGNLPSGTIYSEYEPVICTGLYRKLDTIRDDNGTTIDFFCSDLLAVGVNGGHPEVDVTPCRWGMFNHDAKFAIYEPSDIQIIKENL